MIVSVRAEVLMGNGADETCEVCVN